MTSFSSAHGSAIALDRPVCIHTEVRENMRQKRTLILSWSLETNIVLWSYDEDNILKRYKDRLFAHRRPWDGNGELLHTAEFDDERQAEEGETLTLHAQASQFHEAAQ